MKPIATDNCDCDPGATCNMRPHMSRQATVLFFISIERSCYNSQLNGIFRLPCAKEWNVQVVPEAHSKTKIRKAMEFWKPDGVIMECGDTLKISPDVFGSVPVVLVDIGRRKPPEGVNVVGLDSGAVGCMGAEYLLGLDLPTYAYVGYWLPVLWDRQRRDAFSDTIRKSGRSLSVFFSGRKLPPAERHKRLLAWIKALPRPCGVMACNDSVGEEVLNICTRLGIRVPEDVAVLGVDNDGTLCENTNPTLASIDAGTFRSGTFAAQTLARLMSRTSPGSIEPVRQFYPPLRVEVRQSVRHLFCDRSKVATALELIRQRACEGIRVADVVAGMGVSRRAAEKQFRLATGKSILDEIDDVRFAKVFKLLREPNRRLGAIFGMCGFSTDVALRKAFRLRTGMSMRAWREHEMDGC